MSNARPPKTLNFEQQQQLLDALRSDSAPRKTRLKGIRNYLIACLMLDAGLRVGEVVKLGIADMLFKDVPVSNLLLQPTITKNHRERIIPVTTRLAMAISQMNIAIWREDLTCYTNYAFFTKEPGSTITTRQVENIINTAALKVFGRRINPHMLRHTFASGLMRVTNIRTVQELLGHNYITSTQIYTHPNEDDKKKAIEDLQHETNQSDQGQHDLAEY